MNYKQLKELCEARKIMIKDLAESLGMTPNGFKVSIETEKFPIGKVRDLCSIMELSIAEFFDEPVALNNSGNIINRSTAGGNITAGGNTSEVMFLRQQIKEKDHQIQELLTLLKK